MTLTVYSALSDSSPSHGRQQEYTKRLPTPPRIHVPPPATTSRPSPKLVARVTENTARGVNTSFLRDVSLDHIVERDTLLQWAYKRRWEAQMVLPWVYLGPMTAAKDRDFLLKEGITMTLAIRTSNASLNGALQVGRDMGLDVATIEVPHDMRLPSVFPGATCIINEHMAKVHQQSADAGNPRLGKVLVFCESGNERSATVVAAYLMEMLEDFDHIKSMQVCQAQRFCVSFDDHLKSLLYTYWEILSAKRTVAGFSNPTITHPTKAKRTIDAAMDDEDMEMSNGVDASDLLRFEGRANFEPFCDGAGRAD